MISGRLAIFSMTGAAALLVAVLAPALRSVRTVILIENGKELSL